MITKEITFENFDGEKVTRPFSFHLNQTELLKWETGSDTSIGGMIKNALDNKDPKGIFNFLYELILRSYGEKSEDGFSFVKVKNGAPIRDAFESSPAFDALITELINDPDKLNAFIENVIPASVLKMGMDNLEKNKAALAIKA